MQTKPLTFREPIIDGSHPSLFDDKDLMTASAMLSDEIDTATSISRGTPLVVFFGNKDNGLNKMLAKHGYKSTDKPMLIVDDLIIYITNPENRLQRKETSPMLGLQNV